MDLLLEFPDHVNCQSKLGSFKRARIKPLLESPGFFHPTSTKTISLLVLATSLGTTPHPAEHLPCVFTSARSLVLFACLPAHCRRKSCKWRIVLLILRRKQRKRRKQASHRGEVLTFAQMQHNKHKQTRTNTESRGRR